MEQVRRHYHCTVPCRKHKWRNIKTRSINQTSESIRPSLSGFPCDIARQTNLPRSVRPQRSMGRTHPRESPSTMAKVGTVTPRRDSRTKTHCTASATSSLIRATCIRRHIDTWSRSSGVLGRTPRRWNHTNPCCSESKIRQKRPNRPRVGVSQGAHGYQFSCEREERTKKLT